MLCFYTSQSETCYSFKNSRFPSEQYNFITASRRPIILSITLADKGHPNTDRNVVLSDLLTRWENGANLKILILIRLVEYRQLAKVLYLKLHVRVLVAQNGSVWIVTQGDTLVISFWWALFSISSQQILVQIFFEVSSNSLYLVESN